MAKIILTLEEICKLIEAKLPKHDAIKEVSVFPAENQIAISVKAGFFPGIKLKISYVDFQEGQMRFQIEGNKLINMLLDWFRGTPKSWLIIKGNDLSVQVNDLLQEKLPGTRITDVKQTEDGSFAIELDFGKSLI